LHEFAYGASSVVSAFGPRTESEESRIFRQEVFFWIKQQQWRGLATEPWGLALEDRFGSQRRFGGL